MKHQRIGSEKSRSNKNFVSKFLRLLTKLFYSGFASTRKDQDTPI